MKFAIYSRDTISLTLSDSHSVSLSLSTSLHLAKAHSAHRYYIEPVCLLLLYVHSCNKIYPTLDFFSRCQKLSNHPLLSYITSRLQHAGGGVGWWRWNVLCSSSRGKYTGANCLDAVVGFNFNFSVVCLCLVEISTDDSIFSNRFCK